MLCPHPVRGAGKCLATLNDGVRALLDFAGMVAATILTIIRSPRCIMQVRVRWPRLSAVALLRASPSPRPSRDVAESRREGSSITLITQYGHISAIPEHRGCQR